MQYLIKFVRFFGLLLIQALCKGLIMRKLVVLTAVLTLFLSGCLMYEKEEVKVKLTSSGAEIWVKETGWKSSSEDEKEILEDFKKLMDKYEKDELEEELADFGVYLLDKRIYLQNGKITTEYHGLVPRGSIAYLSQFTESNEEIIHVMDSPIDAEIITNGEILKTQKNAIIVWPSNIKELTWSYTDNEKVNKKDNLTALFEKYREEQNK